MTYQLEQESAGCWAVVLVEDDGGEINTNDRLYRHNLNGGSDPTLIAMNKKHRAHWSRDARTRDELRQTLSRHYPAKGKRLVLEGPDDNGGYDLVLVSPDQPQLIPPRNQTTIGDKGYRLNSPAARLAAMNLAARQFWSRR